MLSRVADSIYWLNRYIERADNTARFVDVNLNMMLDLPPGVTQQWLPLVTTTGDHELFMERYGEATADNVIHFLTFDAKYDNSILSSLQIARENARSIREIISSEMWQEVNDFYLMVKDAASQIHVDMLPDFYRQVKRASHRFAGVMDATMTHNEGWHFGYVGRLLERADKTTRILDVKYFILLPSAQWVGTPLDQIQWMALLKSASAYEMYRKQQHRINPSAVAEFLILDHDFPRSINFCVSRSEKSLHKITNTPVGSWSNPAERSLGRLCSRLGYCTIEDVIDIGLHEFLDQMQRSLNEVGGNIAISFFGQDVPEEEREEPLSQTQSQTVLLEKVYGLT
ncbi:alpha-E domain-containing protein [Spirulina subsalsa FACHB-351]|uniref:Alpha-E domain-containing protein n=1 Tax=Spirulina subsalsa FACHB-351 TaxID=234711 RepID=A0ABT3L3M4_9CYAN|nr:alpha-E domain-containing protein [Spirulina subsalsa]MCW6035709.1 alpha-E domain-containing protein [Spirulina subsalsa FACHB-351]